MPAYQWSGATNGRYTRPQSAPWERVTRCRVCGRENVPLSARGNCESCETFLANRIREEEEGDEDDNAGTFRNMDN